MNSKIGKNLLKNMKKDVLIIGGGITGLSLCWELACLGIESILVEKAPYLGGHVSQFACKATQTCQRCGACVLEDYLSKLSNTGLFELHLNSTIGSFSQIGKKFSSVVSHKRSQIINERCDDCNLCSKVCPVEGALVRPSFDSKLYISNEKCLNSIGIHCEACAQICPQGAIEFGEKTKEIQIEASAVAICTGFTPFDATKKARFGYQRIPGVLTTLELDSLLRTGNFEPAAFADGLKSVAFIQCVGSRDPKLGANYCSRICCGVSIRLARLLKNRYPEIRLSIFYMDIQTFEREFDKTLDQAQNEITFIRAIPSEIRASENNRPEVIYNGDDDLKQITPFDLVILSVGIAPRDPDLPKSFPVLWQNRDGFIGADENDVTAGHPGVFVAGAAQGPKSIADCISQSILAASRIKEYLDRAKMGEKL
ncbi:MAG: FAD-dependent oxidoreductase [Deltaproteobacteria bacterium]|nr:FAD-dependent oxidoreductase [Deltaproteobacteria bacterium]